MKIKTVVHEAEEGAIGPKSPPFRAALPKATAWMSSRETCAKRLKGALPSGRE
jgi:hypothetical protein